MANILIVDDECMINDMIMRNLNLVGHHCDQAYDGREALEKVEKNKYDLILLDIMLPYLSGFELIERIKDVPIIFLTAKGNIEDKIQGLTSGAEDYIVKPFEMLELIARINIVLRRKEKKKPGITLGSAYIDLNQKKAILNGEKVELTPQEFNLLELLILNKNLALSRDKLLELAWGYDYGGDTKTVDVHIQ